MMLMAYFSIGLTIFGGIVECKSSGRYDGYPDNSMMGGNGFGPGGFGKHPFFPTKGNKGFGGNGRPEQPEEGSKGVDASHHCKDLKSYCKTLPKSLLDCKKADQYKCRKTCRICAVPGGDGGNSDGPTDSNNNEVCRDVDPNCAAMGRTYLDCGNEDRDKVDCKMTCYHCTITHLPSGGDGGNSDGSTNSNNKPGCVDRSSRMCAKIANSPRKNFFCNSDPTFKTMCKKSCGICTPSDGNAGHSNTSYLSRVNQLVSEIIDSTEIPFFDKGTTASKLNSLQTKLNSTLNTRTMEIERKRKLNEDACKDTDNADCSSDDNFCSASYAQTHCHRTCQICDPKVCNDKRPGDCIRYKDESCSTHEGKRMSCRRTCEICVPVDEETFRIFTEKVKYFQSRIEILKGEPQRREERQQRKNKLDACKDKNPGACHWRYLDCKSYDGQHNCARTCEICTPKYGSSAGGKAGSKKG